MKKTLVTATLIAAMFSLSQCAKMHSKAPVTTLNDEVTAIKSKYSTAQINKGKDIYNNSCGKCHDLKKPEEFTFKQWKHILPEMCEKSKLSADETALVKAWVYTNLKA